MAPNRFISRSRITIMLKPSEFDVLTFVASAMALQKSQIFHWFYSTGNH